MENWGLVTYRETRLLIDHFQSSQVAKQTVALVVGHELAHQWFGNFVTMVNVFFIISSIEYFQYFVLRLIKRMISLK
jgi:hypothetical protein